MRYLSAILIFCLMAISSFAQTIGQSILKDGITIIPPSGQTLIAFNYGGKYGFIFNDSSAEVVIEPKFDDIYVEDWNLSNKMILVKKDGKWGAINSDRGSAIWSKQPVVKCIYDKMEPYRNGKSKVTQGNKTFFIDTMGHRI